MISACEKKGVPVIHKISEEPFTFGNFTMKFCNTAETQSTEPIGENENAIGLLIEKNNLRAFLAADINNLDGDEDRLAKELGKINLLKVGHHGYDNSTTSDYIQALSPEFAVVTNRKNGISRTPLKNLNSVKAIVYFPTLEELSSDPENASEKAKLVDFTYHCYKTGMLNAVSVGFIPLEWTENKTGYDITKWELLEFSAVAVPANQDAIAEAVKSFGLDESVVKDFFTTQKSGKRISAETKAVLDKLKACGDEIEKCRGQLKTIAKTMNELLASLDEVEEVITDEPKEEVELPDSDDGDEIELPDNEVELPD
jgi:hypothetical protein